MRDELLEHVAGDLRRWHPDLVAPGTLVPNVPLGAALAAVGLPRQPPPRLVDVRVGVHEARQCQQAAPVHARVYAGIRGTDAGDAAVLQSQVDGGVAPGRTLRSRGGVAKVTTLVSRPAALPAVQSTASRVIT